MARRFSGADAVVGAYFRALERSTSPKGTAVGQHARVPDGMQCPARRCKQLGRPIPQENKSGEMVQRCPRCGAPWPMVDLYGLAGQTRSGRGGSAPLALLELGDLTTVVNGLRSASTLSRGDVQVYLAWRWHKFLHPKTATQSDITQRAMQERWAGRAWRPQDVRTACQRARSWLERDLARRGMLDR